ncbi:MAG: ribosomal large subunit pseudouridine synthase C [Polaromonas sp. 39-63-203]|nr:MAG: ribosomal large subunit pseudouridine synthase C [Polaromonas sp. 35-63-240]OYY99381.1 MAG: ribosomal large subunit pseudouridine synthase C [Polaromonas sp. 28-63-22]OYZ83984.1 MAG: ribosomal large subunit pseudouridine synthase C [Polaromonas sp. 24-62-144]OZA97185.1 MAG: ribosomal large subunit pseudouridine synthase C [Polaromonas sp. 39-63-203]HQS30463.1 RluA family pseudouridine synthase [Polaromonas sp.]
MKHIIGAASGKLKAPPARPGKVLQRVSSVGPAPRPTRGAAAETHAPVQVLAQAGGGLPAAPAQATQVTVDEDYAGQRLDNFLIRQLKGVPKTHVYRIIRSGEVRVNKGRAHADTRVEAGDVVRLPPVRTSERAGQKAQAMAEEVARHGASSTVGGYAPSREFPVLFEDEFLLAIDKPAGVAVHGGSGVSFGVIEQLRMARPGADFLELVHRLDRETSGVLLIAKRRMALKLLQEQFRERETDKVYLALVSGAWPASQRVIDKALHKYLLENGERRVKVVANDHPDGMRSVTLVKVKSAIAASPAAPATPLTLLEVTIKTGRTHQIRVHLAGEGHPIAGDDKYGDFELNKALQKSVDGAPALKRMFLHAWSLKFNHPKTRKTIQLQAALPDELQQFLPSRG